MPEDDAFFPADAAAWRAWLERHHETEGEVALGFYKQGSGRANLTWSDAVDEALCFGWIDGVLRSIDAERYAIRFTPRRPRSIWSRVNIEKLERLRGEGRVTPAGERAFAARSEERSAVYAHENRPADLEDAETERLRANGAAWAFWQAQRPSYRRSATWWIVSAKRAETRERRLATLIDDSAAGRRLRHLARRPTGGTPAKP